MTTRCKFKCDSKKEVATGYIFEMLPVTHGSKENEEFFKYTPMGKFEFGTVNHEAASQISVGKEYYIDITEA
jgi:hypothetical protein